MIDRVMSTLFKVSESMKVTPGKNVDKMQQKPFSLEQSIAMETTQELAKTHRSSEAKPTEQISLQDRQDQLPFVPLPLRTPLYEDARFYWKLKDFSAKVEENGDAKVIFSIHTNTLGLLWFSVSAHSNQVLAVQCVTENNCSAEVLRANSPEMQQELAHLGYAQVVVSCRVQPGIRNIADLDPDFANGAQPTLLDVQV